MGGNNANLLQDIRASKNKLNASSQAITQAHTTFSTQSTEFFALVEQLESKFKELEEREAKVEQRENDMRDKTQLLQEKEMKCTEREQKVEVREREVSEKETKWSETEKKMQQNAAKVSSFVQLSVSGTRFTIAKEKLLQHKGSLLEQMIVSDHPPLTSTGEIFIERDPGYFVYITRFLLNLAITPPTTTIEKNLVEQEFEYFKIPFKFSESICISFSSLIDDNNFGEKIGEWLPGKKLKLQYRASKDGLTNADFHKWCDNKGPTFVVIRSTNNYLFGGYTPYNWDTSNAYKNGPEGFLFTLTNPHNIPPTKYSRNLQYQMAIYGHLSHGPAFGGDFYTINTTCTCNFPHSYTDTTGKASNTFTGSDSYQINEMEVYLVL